MYHYFLTTQTKDTAAEVAGSYSDAVFNGVLQVVTTIRHTPDPINSTTVFCPASFASLVK
jgi:hypothetical protein